MAAVFPWPVTQSHFAEFETGKCTRAPCYCSRLAVAPYTLKCGLPTVLQPALKTPTTQH